MASTRTKAKTKAELNAEEKAAAKSRQQEAALKKNAPTPAALDKRSAADIARAAGAQPRDDKQAKTVGIVARGRMVKSDGVYRGPGEIVRGSKAEIEGLRATGFCVDEGRVSNPMRAEGPQVLIEDERSKGVPEPAG